MKGLLVCILCAYVGVTLPASSGSQQSPVFRASVDLVRVDVRVTDGRQPVTDLRAEDFEVRDQGVLQQPRLAAAAAPVHVVLVLDISGSISGEPLRHLLAAARALIGTLGADDRISLLTFSQRLSLPLRTTGDRERAFGALQYLRPSGRTAVYDAAYAGLALSEADTSGRTLLLVFTDGQDNSSWLTERQLSDALKRSQTVMYVVAPPGLRTPLFDMARQTGGDGFESGADRWLAEVFVRTLGLFRSSYLLTFVPTGVSRGDGWHDLQVTLHHRQGRVVARPGYFSR
jgi:VWFA-related protein